MYACLVATLFGGKAAPAVVSSSAALVGALHALGVRRVSPVAPHRKELTAKGAAAIEEHGIRVVQSHSREVVDNLAVGRLGIEPRIERAGHLRRRTPSVALRREEMAA